VKPEIYVSVDVETDGPTPGLNSMLSLGAAAFTQESRTPIGTFEVNLLQLAEGQQDPDTMAWWQDQPEAWAYCRKAPKPVRPAMAQLDAWVRGLPGKSILATWPTWDVAWVTYYLGNFGPGPDNPFGLSALDIKSYAMARLGRATFSGIRRSLPLWVLDGCPPHTHKALEDAVCQGVMLVNLMRGPL
jgi:hypothetical protein